jgi:hypothetical protein
VAEPSPSPAFPLVGEVVYLYAFDVAFEVLRSPLPPLLGVPLEPLALEGDKRNPRRLPLNRPLTARLPPLERAGPAGALRIERAVKVLHVGAISVCFRVPFAVSSLSELVGFHDLRFDGGSMDELARALVDQVRHELAPFLVRPIEPLPAEEAYTVFCLRSHIKDAPEWLTINRREVASLLTQEPDPSLLSEAEVEESTSHALSYYRQDLAVLDWDAALLIDHPKAIDELLHIIEIANIELAELEAYDANLDAVVERAYRDIGGGLTKRRARVLRDLGELRIDLARMGDQLVNITKFFGDWHFARVYKTLSDRFHLPDWHLSVDAKLKTLDEIYQLLKQDQNHRLMVVLEVMIIVLFVADLVLIFLR